MEISNDWLKSIGFTHVPGADEHVLQLDCLETCPEFINSEGDRKWLVVSKDRINFSYLPKELKPKTQHKVIALCCYLEIPLKIDKN